MLRHSLRTLVVLLVLAQMGLAQDKVKKAFEEAAADWRPGSAIVANKGSEKDVKKPVAMPKLVVPPDELSSQKAPARPPAFVQMSDRRSPKAADATPAPCIELDILMGCVVFDEKGELRLKREDAEPEVNRAGTIGANLAAMLNEKKEALPAGVSPGAAGANFLLEGLAGEEKLESLEQFRLRMRADGSKASCQNGRRVPRITGASSSRSGQIVNTLSMDDMGSLISGTAQITESEGIAVELSVESSSLGPEEEGTPLAVSEENTIRTPRIDLLTIQTQFTVADGESIVLSSLVRLWGDKVTETFVVVTATVVK